MQKKFSTILGGGIPYTQYHTVKLRCSLPVWVTRQFFMKSAHFAKYTEFSSEMNGTLASTTNIKGAGVILVSQDTALMCFSASRLPKN